VAKSGSTIVRATKARLPYVALGALLALDAPPARAVDYTLAWTSDFAAVVSGGLQRGARHMGLVEAGVGSDFELSGQRAASWRALVQHTYGGGFTDQWVGDLQTVSNIDAEHGIRLLEAWIEAEVAVDWSLGAGKYDFNREFDSIESGALFLSGSQGMGPDISQSGAAGPSIFPHTAVGFRVQHRLDASRTLRAVLLDTDRSSTNRGGPMLAVEYQQDLARARLVIGGWVYSGDKVCLEDPDDGAKEYGGYASLERPFTEHTTAYVRVGLANPQVERLGSYVGGGLVNTRGLLPGREDSVGLALGVARNGRPYRDAQEAGGIATDVAEYALEATWRIPLGRHFALQPDVQYVINPDTDPAIDDALVFILRLEASL